MNAYSIRNNALALLAATVMGLALLAAPHAEATELQTSMDKAAFDQGLLHVEYQQTEPRNPEELRRLLSAQNLSVRERLDLQRALDSLYEELG